MTATRATKIVGATRDGLLTFRYFWDVLLVATSKSNPTHCRIAPTTIRNQLHVKVGAELLDVKSSPLKWKRQYHPRFGFLGCFFVSLSEERELCPDTCRRNTSVDSVHLVRRLYHRFGLGCFRFFGWRVAFKELCFVYVFVSALCFCGSLWRVSTQCRARSSWYSVLSLPNSSKSREVGNISSPLTSGVRSLEMSDLDVVVGPVNFMFGSFWRLGA